MEEIENVRRRLLDKLKSLENKQSILRSSEIRELYGKIKDQPADKKAEFGQAVNDLKKELEGLVAESQDSSEQKAPIDVTASMDINAERPELLPSETGSVHPISREIALITDIFYRMGFNAEGSREIDDQYHMFESLNFPKGHPARDDYDTFMTAQKDENGEPYVAPAHTSTMQNRVLKRYAGNLKNDEPIAVVVPDRVFRNEDLDARHEHTFYQVEGIYVGEGIHAGMLIATLKEFLQSYYGKELKVRVNPFYFPFTEPSFEFALSCPFCTNITDTLHLDAAQESKEERMKRTSGTVNERQTHADAAMRQKPIGMVDEVDQQDMAVQGDRCCKVCSGEGWIELLGCGMIHPNVLKAADIDPEVYTGFAFGCGIDRLVMMKHGIEDVRHFESANLNFLRQFA